MLSTFANRRDLCYSVGRRARLLSPDEAARAWQLLAQKVEGMGTLDLPKFANLIDAIRKSNIEAKRKP